MSNIDKQDIESMQLYTELELETLKTLLEKFPSQMCSKLGIICIRDCPAKQACDIIEECLKPWTINL